MEWGIRREDLQKRRSEFLRMPETRLKPGDESSRLFRGGFRGAGICGYDSGGKHHTYERKANKKIMHLRFSK